MLISSELRQRKVSERRINRKTGIRDICIEMIAGKLCTVVHCMHWTDICPLEM